jgi:Fe-S cluster assembly protein SufD
MDAWLADFDGFEREQLKAANWLAPARKAALARFAELGFPTIRDEEWRFTNVAPIVKTRFVRPSTRPDVTLDQIRPWLFGDGVAARLVFVNGRFTPELSRLDDIPKGLTVLNIAEAMASHAKQLETDLARHVNLADNAFAALNTAFISDGAFVRVDKPVHALYVTTPGAEPTLQHPRNLFVAEESSQSRLVESYVSLGDGKYFNNAVTEIVAHPNAQVDHYRLQRESERAFHVSTLRTQQDRDSRVTSQSLSIGGGLVRNNIHAMLDGEGADATLNGLFITHNEQHVDHHLRVEHAKPRCTSWEFYKGLLDGKSRGVFTGRIFVHQIAQKTDAKQSNDNLLLSRDAHVDTTPQLEIFADDVRCTHGATIGQMDEDAIFYLRSRGFPLEAARSLLVYAFAGECLGQIGIDPLRNQVQKVILERLPHGRMLGEESPLFYDRDFAKHIRAVDRRRESY